MTWTKEALASRVDELGLGDDLERFASGLEAGERELLQDVLIERSGARAYSARERAEAHGWLRRLWERTDPGRRSSR